MKISGGNRSQIYANKAKKSVRCSLLLTYLQGGTTRFFFDVKSFFILHVKTNLRGNRWSTHNSKDAPIMAKSNFPDSVYVLHCAE